MWSLQKKPEFKQKFPELSEDTQQPQVQSCVGSPTSCRKPLLDLKLLSTCYMADPVVLACADTDTCFLFWLWQTPIVHAFNILPDP